MTHSRLVRTRSFLAALVAVAAVAAAWPVAPVAEAQAPILVRMATLVPDGSSWHLILKEAADKWKQVSGGRVSVRLFPGGVAGDDPDVVRKMRLGTLNAGLLTSVGVAEIDKSVYAMGIPLMYDSYDEVYWVHEKMRPKLEASLEAKGFVVLNWADGGWVQLLHHEAGGGARRPPQAQALHLGGRRGVGGGVALGGLQPRAAAVHRDRDRAADGPRRGAGLAARRSRSSRSSSTRRST